MSNFFIWSIKTEFEGRFSLNSFNLFLGLKGGKFVPSIILIFLISSIGFDIIFINSSGSIKYFLYKSSIFKYKKYKNNEKYI